MPETPETTPAQRQAIRTLLAVTVLIVVMDITILNVALEQIQTGLSASNADLQWALDAYMITFAAFIFTGGVLGDRLGRRRVLLGGLGVFGIASLLAGVSGSIGELIAWRAVMGIGAAVVPTVTLAIIVNVFPPPERPKAIAAWAAAAGVAFAVGPVLGGLLLEVFSWSSVFLVNVPLVLVGGVLIARLVPESVMPKAAPLDPLGVVLSVVSVSLVVFGIVEGGRTNEWLSAGVLAPGLVGLLLAAVFVVLETRSAAPSFDVSLLRNSRFAAGSGVIALGFFALMGTIYLTTFFFQIVRDYSPLEAGLLMLPMGVGSAFMSSRCPKLVPRVGVRTVVASGTALMGVAFLGYAFVEASTTVAAIIALQLVFGLGWGCVMAPATGALMSVVPLPKAGAGQAVANTLRQIAAALGVAVVGSVLSATYRGSAEDALAALPPEARERAGTSVGDTLQVLAGSSGSGLGAEARAAVQDGALAAYTSAMHSTVLIAAAAAFVAAIVAARWLPGVPPAPAAAPQPSGARLQPGAPS